MYKLSIYGNIVHRLTDGVWIPFADKNADYQDYLKWVAAGNIPEPADPIRVPMISDETKALRLLLRNIETRTPEDEALKDELLTKLGDTE